jgi:amino acid transporter
MQELKKILDFKDLLFISLSDIIGVGLFVSFSNTLLYSGSNIFLAFIIISISSLISGLSYSEISFLYKSNISDFFIIKELFGETYSNFIAFCTFIFGLLTVSTIIITLSKNLFNKNRNQGVIFSIFILSILFIINYFGIELSRNIIDIISFISVILLVFIIIYGIIYIQKYDINIKNTFSNNDAGIFGFLKTCTFLIFLFAGYNSIFKMYDEIKKETIKDLPLCCSTSIIISSIIYILITFLIIKLFNDIDIREELAPLSILYKKLIGILSYKITYYISIIIIIGACFTTLLSETRYIYGLSKEKILPDIFAKLSIYNTPYYTLILAYIICIMLVLIDNEKITMNMTNIFTFIILITINISIVLYRYYNSENFINKNDIEKEEKNIIKNLNNEIDIIYKMPFYYKEIPILPLINSIFLFILLIVCFIIFPTLY